MFDAIVVAQVFYTNFVIIAFSFFDFGGNTLCVRHKHRQSVYRNTCKTYHSSFWSHQVNSKMLFMLILYLFWGCESRIQPNTKQGNRMCNNNERQWNFIESVTNARYTKHGFDLRVNTGCWSTNIGGLIKIVLLRSDHDCVWCVIHIAFRWVSGYQIKNI